MTIQEAWEKILEIRGDKLTCVTIRLWRFTTGKIEQELCLYDKSSFLRAKNLPDLVRLAEISMGPEESADGELPEIGAEHE